MTLIKLRDIPRSERHLVPCNTRPVRARSSRKPARCNRQRRTA